MQKTIFFSGQSLATVGVYLEQEFFSHGCVFLTSIETLVFIYDGPNLKMSLFISCSQLYVALSRVRSPQNLKLFQPQESKSGKTINVVYREVL